MKLWQKIKGALNQSYLSDSTKKKIFFYIHCHHFFKINFQFFHKLIFYVYLFTLDLFSKTHLRKKIEIRVIKKYFFYNMLNMLGISSLLLLSSCTTPYVNPPYSVFSTHQVAGTAIGGAAVGGAVAAEAMASGSVVGAAVGVGFGSYLVSTSRMLKILQAEKVQVVQIGKNLRVIIPADQLFAPGATNLEPQASRILDDVAMFLMRYGEVPITVYAFSDQVYDNDLAFKITAAQSRRVSGYLWSKGRPFYHLRAEGMGNRYAVASNGNPYGSYYNRRIEILLPVVQPKMRYLKAFTQSLY